MFKAFRNFCELNGTKGIQVETSQLLILRKWKSLQNSGYKMSEQDSIGYIDFSFCFLKIYRHFLKGVSCLYNWSVCLEGKNVDKGIIMPINMKVLLL